MTTKLILAGTIRIGDSSDVGDSLKKPFSTGAYSMTLPAGIDVRHVIEPEGLNRVYRGDCVEVMKSIPSASVDLILLTPPTTYSSPMPCAVPTKAKWLGYAMIGTGLMILTAMTCSPMNGWLKRAVF